MKAHRPRVGWRIDRSLMGRPCRQPAAEPGPEQRRLRREDIEARTEELEWSLNLLAFARPLDTAVCHECVRKNFVVLQV